VSAAEQSAPHTNWGRWGPGDERGALNVVDGAMRLAAARGLRTGEAFTLAYPLDANAPRTPRRNPPWNTTRISRKPQRGTGTIDDVLTTHTHVGTHLDALCHYWGPEGLYNGFDPDEITSDGAPRLGVHNVGAIATRGLVVDLRSRCPRGEAGWGHEITARDIAAELDAAGLSVAAGDAVLLCTGWETQFAERPETYAWGEPGIGLDAAEWLAERDVVLVGADTWAVEAIPPAVHGEGLPVHRCLLNRNGIYILENLVLSELIAATGTCAGLLVVAPMLLRGGAGSPVTPVFLC
jgi:kynurenine formamidase